MQAIWDNFSIFILAIIFILTAVRQIGKKKFQLWEIMFFGALILLLTQRIGWKEGFEAIDWDVIFFLWGMFVAGETLSRSGYLSHLSFIFFNKAKNLKMLFLFILILTGGFSALLMNDTIAVIGAPLVIYFAQKHKVSSEPLLLALCFGVTIGSVFSPLGNPQNLLIALYSKMPYPFQDFFYYLALPSFVNLLIAFLFIRFFYQDDFHDNELLHEKDLVKDHHLFRLAQITILLIILGILLKIIFSLFFPSLSFHLTWIALLGALPSLLFSPQRFSILKKIDWHTLLFFIGLFVVMRSVWLSPWIKDLVQQMMDFFSKGFTIGSILWSSVLLSQILSNVPFVALFLPLLEKIGVSLPLYMALAAGSTIAGNMLILGAASNIIIIQNAEKQGHTLSFWRFARIGIPLTIVNVLVYWIFLSLL